MPGRQILPKDDLFAEGSPVYGDALQRYIGIQPWVTNPETATGFSLKVGWGHIFDGRSGLGGPAKKAATTKQASVPDADRGIFVVQRDTQGWAHGEVYFYPDLHMISGEYDSDTVRIVGCCARVAGGTLTTPAGGDHSDKYYADVSGYFFVHAKQTALRHKLFLLSVNAGAVTVLQEKFVDELPGGKLNGSQSDDAELPQPMRMVIEDAGSGAIDVKCYRRRFVSAASVGTLGNPQTGGQVTEDQVFTTLNIGAPVTSSGRCGFGLQLAKSQGTGDSTMLCREFRVKTGSTLHSRDRFERNFREAQRQLTDELSQTGYSLESSFTGDSQGEAASSLKHFGHLLRDTATADQLRAGSTPPSGSGQVHGWYMSQRAAESVQQHRRIQYKLVNVTTEEVRVGIHLRGVWFPAQFPDMRARATVGGGFRDYRKQGYLCLVKYVPGGSPVWQLEVRGHRRGGNTNSSYRSTLLATADLTSAALAIGTAFTMQLEVRNFDGNLFGDGLWPAMRAKVNGTVITPVVESGLQGVVENDDWLIDSRAEASIDGLGEGLYIDVDAVHASQLVEVDSWEEQALTDPPNSPSVDESSIVLAAETAAKTGTLSTPLSWPVDFQPGSYEPVKHRFETGHQQVFPRTRTPRRRWTVQCSGASTAERAALQTFFRSHKGVEVPFDWVRPSAGQVASETVSVRLVDDSLSHVLDWASGDGSEGYALVLEEVFDHVNFNDPS